MPSYKKRKEVGKNPNETEWKNHLTAVLTSSTGRVYQSLFSFDLTALPRASTGISRTLRHGEEIFAHGIRLKFYVNIRDKPVYLQETVVRMWVVSRIGTDELTIPGDTETDPIVTTNFYRGQSDSRAEDFNAVNRSAWSHLNHSINTDSYNVLCYKQCFLYPQIINNSSVNQGKGVTILWDEWINLGRKITYDSDSPVTIPTNGRVFLIWYVDNLARPAAGVSDATNQYRCGVHANLYYKEMI